MVKQVKIMPNQAHPHLEKKLPEFLTHHVKVKTIKKVSMATCGLQDKNCDGFVIIPKRKISSSEPPGVPESVLRVLQNPKLVTDILRKLCLVDLKSCRRVSKTWEELTSHILQIRRNIQITLVFSPSKGAYFQPVQNQNEYEHVLASAIPPNGVEKKQKSLKNLLTCLESSRNFPCQNFQIVSGDFGSCQVQEFLNNFGSQIKQLHLTFGRQNKLTLVEILRHLLLHQAPNIEHLTMSIVSYSPCLNNLSDLFSSPVKLNLKTLCVGQWFPSQRQIIRDILIGSPRLEEFYEDHFVDNFLNVVIDSYKIHTIQKISFSLWNCSKYYLEQFYKLAALSPFLTNLEICTQERDWKILKMAASIINQFLKSSQLTLKSLTLYPLNLISRNYKIQFPPLKNLQTLVLRTGTSSNLISVLSQSKLWEGGRVKNERMFPCDLNTETIFPNVRTAVIDLVSDDDLFWDHHFGQCWEGQFKLVKYLEIQRPCTNFWIQKLAVMFPNVEDLKLTVDVNDPIDTKTLFGVWYKLEFVALRNVGGPEKIEPN